MEASLDVASPASQIRGSLSPLSQPADASLSEKERMTQLAQLLDKETTLLQTIDRLKITANKENRGKRIKKMLNG